MSQMQSVDIESGVQDLLRTGLRATLGRDIDVDSLGEKDINDDDQLVFNTPCVRTRYVGGRFTKLHDNTATSYDDAPMIEIWCADEDLSSKSAQREASKRLLDIVKPIVAGARIPLTDDEPRTTDPIELLSVAPLPQDIVGAVYILTVVVPGIAVFPGTYSQGSED